MFKNVSPDFNLGRILKKDMFISLRDYPRNFVELQFKEYSDGIICGADIIAEADSITITTGIIKHEGRLYVLEGEYRLPYYYSGIDSVIKVRFIDKALNNELEIYSSQIFMDEDTEIKGDEIELGRFKLREGAKLRTEYQGFLDLSTEYNTLNRMNVEYASFGQPTVSPIILDYFCKEMQKYKTDNMQDITFIMQCKNQHIVSREAILRYISSRLEFEYKDYSNSLIYKYLGKMIKESRASTGSKQDFRPGGQKRIMVD